MMLRFMTMTMRTMTMRATTVRTMTMRTMTMRTMTTRAMTMRAMTTRAMSRGSSTERSTLSPLSPRSFKILFLFRSFFQISHLDHIVFMRNFSFTSLTEIESWARNAFISNSKNSFYSTSSTLSLMFETNIIAHFRSLRIFKLSLNFLNQAWH